LGGSEIRYADPGPRALAILELAREKGVPAFEEDPAELERWHPDSRGIVLVLGATGRKIDFDAYAAAAAAKEEGLAIVLDHLSDPHNFGAILRSADQFGADIVVTPQDRSVRETDAVFSASAGAAAWVPQAVVPNLARAVEKLKEAGFWVYAADMGGTPAWDMDLRGKVALVLGSEGKGVGRLLRRSADAVVSVPSGGMVESLNVSVAAGILMYEARRAAKKPHSSAKSPGSPSLKE
jgi:23S rRNA (guanosine2251-2'-O)-methyltransferase